MNRLLPRLAIAIAVAGLLCSNPGTAQVLPPLKRPARVVIVKGPEVELSFEHLTTIRWTSNNPGGSDVHYGVVHYGTDPKDLSQTAKNPIRLNHGHRTSVFRVDLEGLKPQTTYYYRVNSEESNGNSDRVKSPIKKFTTAKPGERIVNFPKPSADRRIVGLPKSK
jgi:hypothetical protein